LDEAFEKLLHKGAAVRSKSVTPISQLTASEQQVPENDVQQQKVEDVLEEISSVGVEIHSGERPNSETNVHNKDHWKPLQFEFGPYELSGIKEHLNECWRTIEALDGRVRGLRRHVAGVMDEKLDMAFQLSNSVYSQHMHHVDETKAAFGVTKKEFDVVNLGLEEMRKEIGLVKLENQKLLKENNLLKKEFEKNKKESQVLWKENVGIKKEIEYLKEGKEATKEALEVARKDNILLKKEIKRAQDVVLNIIDYLDKERVVDRLGLLEKDVSEALKMRNKVDLRNRMWKDLWNSGNDGNNGGNGDSESASSKNEQSNAKEEVNEPSESSLNEEANVLPFFEQPLLDPAVRRDKIARGKLPRPTPNMDALNGLPKFRGQTDRMGPEELQEATMEWLGLVEGVIIAQDASVQDVYDKLPKLLEGSPKVWFQRIIEQENHFKTWKDFRYALIKTFLGPEWKRNLENSFAVIRQREKEPALNYMLRVWNLAKQINPAYDESAILSKIATTMKQELWNKIPLDKRDDYNSVLSCITVYDKELRSQGKQPNPNQPERPSKPPPRKGFAPSNRERQYKIMCYFCGKEGHVAKSCPSRKLVATVITNLEAKEEKEKDKKKSGKGEGAVPRT
jgi:hypothetical protein